MKQHDRKPMARGHVDYLATQLQRLGWDPVVEYIQSVNQLAHCIRECENPVERGKLIEAQANLIEKVWKYCFPAKRSVEVSGTVEQKQTMSLTQEQLAAVLEQDIFRRAIEIKPTEAKEHGETRPAPEAEDPFSAD
jgi:hypothetical protein